MTKTIIRFIGLVAILLTIFGIPQFNHVVADNNIPKCHGKTKGPDDDSPWTWDEGSTDIPCDEHIYTITGIVQDVNSLTRQISPSSGSGSCVILTGSGGCSSHSSGEVIDGKGFLVLNIISSDSSLAPAGYTVIIKATDTKASFIPVGYKATFKCRHEYEAVAALVDQEHFGDAERDAAQTDELDFCRMVDGTIYPAA